MDNSIVTMKEENLNPKHLINNIKKCQMNYTTLFKASFDVKNKGGIRPTYYETSIACNPFFFFRQ